MNSLKRILIGACTLILVPIVYAQSPARSSCSIERYKWEMDKNSEPLTNALEKCIENAKAAELAAEQASAKEKAQRASQAKVAAKAAEDQKKKGGVHIGMSMPQVLASSWGKPKDIRRTTTANTEREQWIYGGGNYLYFTNGKLTAIQN